MLLAAQEVRTFFVTSDTFHRHAIFQSERMSNLLLHVMQDYRSQRKFLLNEFVVMPDHFHLLLTPAANTPLEKAVRYIKGGFSFRAKKELDFRASIWERSFTNYRVGGADHYARLRCHIRRNPAKRCLAGSEDRFPYSSAYPGAAIDPDPPWLKP
jgi:putative transposase